VSHERCSEALNRFADAVQGSGQDGQGLVSGLLTQGQLQQQEALCRVLAGVLPPGELIILGLILSSFLVLLLL
jgi:hypothetical protein